MKVQRKTLRPTVRALAVSFTLAMALASGLFKIPANAQTLDCTNPTSQAEMTGCAARAHETADAKLNAAYRLAVKQAKSQDQYLDAGQVPSQTMLRDAQRAWITYRDRACETESTLARGGTMQNQIFFICMERLTKNRARDLMLFGHDR